VRAEQKLVRHGNATGVNIPRQILTHLGWLPGEAVVVELLEDKSLRLRRRTVDDYAPIRSPRIVYDEPGKVIG
jgi:antitoxin component of MazEF toxin-antitoxin module